MLRGERVKVRSNELVRAEWSPQNFETTLGCWEAGIPHPGWFRAWRARECGRLGAAGVPTTGFCRVEVYVRVLEEVDLQAIKQEGRAAWLTGEVDVVEEGPRRLAGDELGLQRAQCRGEAKGEECRHQRVTLFTTFGLVDAVRGSITIGPEELGRGAVEQPDERQCAASIRDPTAGCKHCLSADEVEGTDPVDRQHCERRVPVTLNVEGVSQGFGPGTGGQRVLMRPGGLVEGSRELLRERTRDEAAQEVVELTHV